MHRGLLSHLCTATATCAKSHSSRCRKCLPRAVESPLMTWTAGMLLAATVAFAQPKRPVQEFETSAGTVKITPIQHASLVIEAGGQVIAIDPVSGGNYAG